MIHVALQQIQRVRRIAIEADINEELSKLRWHLIFGRFGHRRFPDSVVFEQIQRDSSRFESGTLYAVDCLKVLKACGFFDVHDQQLEAIAFHLFDTHRVQSFDDSGSIFSRLIRPSCENHNDVGFLYRNIAVH